MSFLIEANVLDFELHHSDAVKTECRGLCQDAVAVLVEFQLCDLVFLRFGFLDDLAFGIVFVFAGLFGKHFDRGEVFAFCELVFGDSSEFGNLCHLGFFSSEKRCGLSNSGEHGVSDKVMLELLVGALFAVDFHEVFAVRGELVFKVAADFGVCISGQGNGNIVFVIVSAFPAFAFYLVGRGVEVEVLGSVVRVDACKSLEVKTGVVNAGERSEWRLLHEKLRCTVVTDITLEQNKSDNNDDRDNDCFCVILFGKLYFGLHFGL